MWIYVKIEPLLFCGPDENRTHPRALQGRIASLGTCGPIYSLFRDTVG